MLRIRTGYYVCECAPWNSRISAAAKMSFAHFEQSIENINVSCSGYKRRVTCESRNPLILLRCNIMSNFINTVNLMSRQMFVMWVCRLRGLHTYWITKHSAINTAHIYQSCMHFYELICQCEISRMIVDNRTRIN